jgi:hypothetical protein
LGFIFTCSEKPGVEELTPMSPRSSKADFASWTKKRMVLETANQQNEGKRREVAVVGGRRLLNRTMTKRRILRIWSKRRKKVILKKRWILAHLRSMNSSNIGCSRRLSCPGGVTSSARW